MKKVYFLILIISCLQTMAQDRGEKISPVTYSKMQPDYSGIKNILKSTKSTVDSNFVFVYDTLLLPLLDDFSTNKFQSYEDVSFTGPNVTEFLFYKLFDENQLAPLAPNSSFVFDSTFRVQVDTLNDGSFIYDSIPLIAIDIFVNDLSEFPVIGSVEKVWPSFMIYDTLYILGHVSDTVLLIPDAAQDSARVFEVSLSGTDVYWLDNSAYHNYHYGFEPRSLGVVTFDGTAASGIPYDLGNEFSYGVADVLTSKPINLSVHNAADSVYLSFIFQAGGRGEMPDQEDSLIVEFYTPGNGVWVRQWTSPFVEDSIWRTAHIPLNLNAFFENGFQFRFRNFANLSGSFDHWHIDYVHLRPTSAFNDILINDLAVMEPVAGLIQPYTAAPWKHYKEHPGFFMNNSTEVPVINNYNQAKLTDPGTLLVEYEGGVELLFNVGDPLGNYNALTKYMFPFDFSAASYQFDPNVDDSTAVFMVKTILTTPTTPELLTVNDTGVYKQEFLNYYAYDDGTAEAAYGPYGLGAKLAYKFEMPQGDTLLGALIHFTPSAQDLSGSIFLLTVWDDFNGEPGNVLYQDDFFTANEINYTGAINGFDFYKFGDDLQIEIGEVFYIGWEQIDPTKLNIGFDYNNNNQDKIFFNVDGNWYNTVFEGSLLMRPIIKSNIDFYLGIEPKIIETKQIEFNVYPNPAESIVQIDWLNIDDIINWEISVYSISGRLMNKYPLQKSIDISTVDAGIYILTFTNQVSGETSTKKIIKK